MAYTTRHYKPKKGAAAFAKAVAKALEMPPSEIQYDAALAAANAAASADDPSQAPGGDVLATLLSTDDAEAEGAFQRGLQRALESGTVTQAQAETMRNERLRDATDKFEQALRDAVAAKKLTAKEAAEVRRQRAHTIAQLRATARTTDAVGAARRAQIEATNAGTDAIRDAAAAGTAQAAAIEAAVARAAAESLARDGAATEQMRAQHEEAMRVTAQRLDTANRLAAARHGEMRQGIADLDAREQRRLDDAMTNVAQRLDTANRLAHIRHGDVMGAVDGARDAARAQHTATMGALTNLDEAAARRMVGADELARGRHAEAMRAADENAGRMLRAFDDEGELARARYDNLMQAAATQGDRLAGHIDDADERARARHAEVLRTADENTGRVLGDVAVEGIVSRTQEQVNRDALARRLAELRQQVEDAGDRFYDALDAPAAAAADAPAAAAADEPAAAAAADEPAAAVLVRRTTATDVDFGPSEHFGQASMVRFWRNAGGRDDITPSGKSLRANPSLPAQMFRRAANDGTVSKVRTAEGNQMYMVGPAYAYTETELIAGLAMLLTGPPYDGREIMPQYRNAATAIARTIARSAADAGIAAASDSAAAADDDDDEDVGEGLPLHGRAAAAPPGRPGKKRKRAPHPERPPAEKRREVAMALLDEARRDIYAARAIFFSLKNNRHPFTTNELSGIATELNNIHAEEHYRRGGKGKPPPLHLNWSLEKLRQKEPTFSLAF